MARIITKGIHANRLKDPMNRMELAFAEEWELENRTRSGRPTALLYWLKGTGNQPDITTPKEEVIAATIIQWLGSPVGQSFLERVRMRQSKAGKETRCP